ncbi:MAG TPA: ATP-binding cassette domain-containing protein [Spirochaetota bacterium]|nr:ATP-binding cassette domain-containing protein [Spirochaetota bacterium]HPQ49509.1 ATP-binding cassette domain-containing protein [Spirochaetota bacterium]
MTEIRAISLIKDFSTRRVINNISMDINQGNFILIKGPSGAGKTTLAMIISGLIKPDGGSVHINGRNYYNLSRFDRYKLRKSFSYIFQNNIFINNSSVIENILIPFINKKASKNDFKKALYYLDLFGLNNTANKKIYKLSGGEQAIIGIIRGIITEEYTDVIIADEPTSQLNEELEEKILKIFKYLNSKGKTILLISHSKKAELFAKEIYFMENGKITNYEKRIKE